MEVPLLVGDRVDKVLEAGFLGAEEVGLLAGNFDGLARLEGGGRGGGQGGEGG